MVHEYRRLRSEDQLRMQRCRLGHPGQHFQGRRVEAEFGFVEGDQHRELLFRLEEQRGESDESQRAIR